MVRRSTNLTKAELNSKVEFTFMFYKHQEIPQNAIAGNRKAAKLTQAELAGAVGVTRQTVIAIEKGNYTPSVLLSLKLARVLGKKVEELFWI